MSGIFDHAESIGLIERNPARRLLKALPPVEQKNYAAAATLEDARRVLVAVEALNAFPGTKLASRLKALTAVRSEALRKARPEQFEGLNGAEPIWRIPAANMKLSATLRKRRELEFIVPLSPHSVEIVKLARQLSHGSPWLFPGTVNPLQPMSEGTLERLYKRVASSTLKHVPHGWRSTFSTIMNERSERAGRAADRAIIDLMLAHRASGVEASYNRASYMERRREIANEWADLLLDGLAPSSTLIQGRKR
jgi:integrase